MIRNFKRVTLAALLLFTFLPCLIQTEGKPAESQVSREMLFFSYVRKAYSLIRSSYYKKVSDETLLKGAVSRMKKVSHDIPELREYTWTSFEHYYFEQSRKNPPLAGALAEAALDGVVDSLKDPYSILLTPEKKKILESGDGSGIGVELGAKKGKVVVIAPVLGSSAEKAGVMSGDILLAVNGRSVAGLSLYEATMLISGRRGEKIDLTLLRGEKKITLSPVFSSLNLDPIRYALLSDNIGFIKIGIFNGAVFNDFAYVLNVMKEKKVRGLIIDLRNNPGGDLNESLRIAARFVPSGVLVWVQKEGREAEPKQSGSGETFPAPVVVLINEGSASASEVLAGALAGNKKAVLAGKKTFGKGVIQTQYKMTGGAVLNLTTESYLTPDKQSIDGIGLTPHLPLPDCSQKGDPTKDPAVIAAWKYLKNK